MEAENSFYTYSIRKRKIMGVCTRKLILLPLLLAENFCVIGKHFRIYIYAYLYIYHVYIHHYILVCIQMYVYVPYVH